MSADTREITTVLSARNLSAGVVDGFNRSIAGIGTTAVTAANRVEGAFKLAGGGVVEGSKQVIEQLTQGGDLGQTMAGFGAMLAGEMGGEMIAKLMEKLAGSSLVAAIGPALAGAGSAVGGVISAAIPIGMAALPFLLVGAIVLAIAFLVTHPEVAGKILEVGGSIVSGIVKGLASLGGAILHVFSVAFGALVDLTVTIVGGIVGFYLGIPGRLADFGRAILGVFSEAFGAVSRFIGGIVAGIVGVIGGIITKVQDALDWIHRLITDSRQIPGGPANIAEGITHHAGGGWAGLNGPELSWLGEKGPEYVSSNDEVRGGGSARGVTIEGVSESELIDIVERGVYVRLRLAPAGS